MAFKYIDGEIIEIEHETVSGRLVEVSALDSFENKLLITLNLKGIKAVYSQIISADKKRESFDSLDSKMKRLFRAAAGT